MPTSDDQRLVDLAARVERDDPRFARSLSSGRPALPREYRRTRAWWVLGIGLVLLLAGLIMPDGLLIAAGLVLSGIGVQLFDPYPPRKRDSEGDGVHGARGDDDGPSRR
ncbi:DUF3040 domain-containing protein [Streptomyces sp. enrichment culture]|uniref:DUF3040 domain-containing protein n=1 Tax=Streptomyces sp. enrichment culture TaxID=1795815 RepID=UPI003F55CFE8